MALSLVIVDKKVTRTNPFALFLLLSLFGLCTRKADQNYTGLRVVHVARQKKW